MGTLVRPLPAEQWARYSVLNVGLSKSVVMAAQELCPWIPLSTINIKYCYLNSGLIVELGMFVARLVIVGVQSPNISSAQ